MSEGSPIGGTGSTVGRRIVEGEFLKRRKLKIIKRTFYVDGGFDLLQPSGLNVMSELLHRRLDVADFDSLFALLVKRVERVSRSCMQQYRYCK